MAPAAVGIADHLGWAWFVAVALEDSEPVLLASRRMALAAAGMIAYSLAPDKLWLVTLTEGLALLCLILFLFAAQVIPVNWAGVLLVLLAIGLFAAEVTSLSVPAGSMSKYPSLRSGLMRSSGFGPNRGG